MTTQDAQNEAGRVDEREALDEALARRADLSREEYAADCRERTPPPEANATQEGGGSEAAEVKRLLTACGHGDNLYARALRRIVKLETDCRNYDRTMQVIGSAPLPSASVDAGPVVTTNTAADEFRTAIVQHEHLLSNLHDLLHSLRENVRLKLQPGSEDYRDMFKLANDALYALRSRPDIEHIARTAITAALAGRS